MIAQEFLEKFPGAKRNEGCLVDIACPYCGSRGPFEIVCSRAFSVHDDGTDDAEDGGDTQWSLNSWCTCHAEDCQQGASIVSDFTIDGLDALIESNGK